MITVADLISFPSMFDKEIEIRIEATNGTLGKWDVPENVPDEYWEKLVADISVDYSTLIIYAWIEDYDDSYLDEEE